MTKRRDSFFLQIDTSKQNVLGRDAIHILLYVVCKINELVSVLCTDLDISISHLFVHFIDLKLVKAFGFKISKFCRGSIACGKHWRAKVCRLRIIFGVSLPILSGTIGRSESQWASAFTKIGTGWPSRTRTSALAKRKGSAIQRRWGLGLGRKPRTSSSP